MGTRAAEDISQEAFVGRATPALTTPAGDRGDVAPDDHPEPRHRLGAGAPPVVVDPDSILALNLSAGGPLPDELAALRDDADRLCAALTQLPVEQRRALVMAGLLGHTAREVSEAEGIPLGTAKTRIRTALLRLRSALTEERAE